MQKSRPNATQILEFALNKTHLIRNLIETLGALAKRRKEVQENLVNFLKIWVESQKHESGFDKIHVRNSNPFGKELHTVITETKVLRRSTENLPLSAWRKEICYILADNNISNLISLSLGKKFKDYCNTVSKF